MLQRYIESCCCEQITLTALNYFCTREVTTGFALTYFNIYELDDKFNPLTETLAANADGLV
jgi:hypothetical protein